MAKVIDAGSDIQLLFGVLGGGELSGESGALIKRQLTELQRALNADPFKIKVALDTEAGGKKSWSSMLQTKLNALGDSEKFSIKISKLDIGDGAIGDLKRRIEAVLNTLSLERGVSLSVKAEDVGEVASKVKAAGDAAAEAARKTAEFNAQMETLNGQKSEVLKALNAAEKADLTEEESARVRELRTQYEGYAKSIYEVNAAKSVATPEHRAEIEAEGRAILENVNALNEERRARDEAAKSAEREAAQSAADERAKANEANLYKQIADAIIRVQAAQQNWTAAQHGNASVDYAQLDGYIQRLQNLRATLDTVTPEKAKATLADIIREFKNSSEAIRAAGENTRTFTERLGGLASKFGIWLSASRIVMMAVRLTKQLVRASIELDDAMTQLQIVTRASNEELEAYSKTAAETARRIGSSISDFVGSTTTYARLGYNTEQSSALAQYTAMLQNVGNIEVGDAQDAITSIVKAFGIGVDEIESVMDKLVVTGNNFPISVSQIAEGMTNASSALAAAGNTFDQSVALLTAANTTVQNAAKASTGLRTIAARLRNTKTELDDLGEAMIEGTYEELVAALTKYNVALRDSAGEFRSTYDIIADIAEVWDKMSTTEQAGLATAVSGTRQQAIFFSLVEQFQEAQGAMEDMANSAGTLEESYGIYMDSVTAHVNQLKAAFQGLGQETFTREFLVGVVDLGTTLVNIAGAVMDVVNKLGGLNTVLYTTLGILATINAQAILAQIKKILGIFPKVISFVTRLGQAVPIAISLFREGDLAALDGAPTVLGKITTALQAVGISASAAQIAVGAFVAVLGVVLLAVSAHNRAMEEARQRAEEAARAYETTVSSIDGYKEKIAELKRSLDEGNLSQEEAYNARVELLALQGEIRDAYGKEAEAIDLVGDSAERSAEKLSGLTRAAANEFLSANASEIDKAIEKMETVREYFSGQGAPGLIGDSGANAEVTKAIRDIVSKYKHAWLEYGLDTKTGGKLMSLHVTADAEDAKETLVGLAADFEKLRKDFLEKGINIEEIFPSDNTFAEKFEKTISRVDEIIEEYGETYDKAIQAKIVQNDVYAGVMDQITGANKALREAVASGDAVELAEAAEAVSRLFVDPERIDDAGVRKYMEELIAQMQAEALKYAINVRLAADVDTDDWTKRVKAALGVLAGEDGVVTATDIRDAGITARAEGENAAQTRGYMSAEALAWAELDIAASEYHTDVEGLIPLLEQYGYLTKSATDEMDGETAAAVELADALSALGGLYDLLTKAQSEMDAGGLSPGTAQSIIKELAEAGEDYTEYLTEENGVLKLNTEAWDAYIAAKRAAADGGVGKAVVESMIDEAALTRLDDARERLEELQKALDGLDGADELSTDAYETLEGLLPGITSRVNSVKDAQELLNEAIAKQKEVTAEAYAEYVWGAENSIFADEDRCERILAENQGLTDTLNKCYGVDLDNWGDLAKGKWAIEKSLVGDLSELWQKYHNVSDEELKSSIQKLESKDRVKTKVGRLLQEGGFLPEDALIGLNDEERKELDDMKAALAVRQELARQWQELNDAINGAGSGGSGSKSVEAYIADIDRFRKAVEALRKAQEDRERVEGSIEGAGSYERKIGLEQELITAYKSEQEALHALNDARDEAIAEGAESLRALGFEVAYNADTNELWIENLEHLNELTAKSRGKYDSLQEATNGLRKETEELIETITDLNEKNREGSKSWLEIEKSIREAMLAVFEMRRAARENAVTLNENWQENAIEGYDYGGVRLYTENLIAQRRAMQEELHREAEYYRSLGYSDTSDEVSELSDLWWDYEREISEAVATAWGQVVDNASSAVDEIQEVYDVLHEAADEFAANGFITVDTFQSIVGLGAQYMRYLTDENGLLKINHDSIDAVIAAKTRELAMNEALAYVERLRASLQDGNIEQLQELLYATTQATGGTWGLIYANLALLDLDGDQYEAALHNINAIRALADAAVSGVGQTAGSLSNELQDMKTGLDDILKYVMDMLKQRVQDQIDALEDMKDAYAELIDLRKKSLENAEKEADYQETVAEKTRELAKLQERIDALSLDNSRDAAAQRAKLEEEMADLQKELADTQADHAREAQEDALDDMQSAYEAEKDGEIAALEESVSSTEKLYRMAIEYIRDNWETLKDELIQWNYEVGTSFQYDIENAWDAALKAAQRYGDYVTALGGIDADISAAGGSVHNDTVSGSTQYDASASREEEIHAIIREMWANAQAWFGADEDGRKRLDQRNLDLGNRLAAYGINARRENGTWYEGDELLFEKYKKYLYHKGGIAGDKPTLKQNEVLAVLEKGEPVLDKRKEAGLFRLVDFTTDLMNRFDRLTAARGAEGLFGNVRRPVPEVGRLFPEGKRGISVQFGDVYIYGADDRTVEKHREVNRQFVNDVIKQLGLKR